MNKHQSRRPKKIPEKHFLTIGGPYTAGTTDSEKYIFPDLKKISHDKLLTKHAVQQWGIESQDI